MTCQRSDIYWRDALYSAVSRAPGNVQAAAAWLSDRRGRRITGEALRKKLRGLEGESLSMEMAELLTEYLQQFVDTQPEATDWIASLAAQFDLMVDYVPPPPQGGWPNELDALQKKLLELHTMAGRLSGTTLAALTDGDLTLGEADAMQDLARSIRTLCYRLERNATRAVRKAVGRE
ncbi:hypothetical protein [Stenotrophomonas nematodicola]|uniref:hypothetical protein n=1 Tax=Stenotrophomonas nematodicola TaxID=2656746 RepID=UPI0012914F0D|nr:hypothetical protein [Stenotrophomonas nematodicola]